MNLSDYIRNAARLLTALFLLAVVSESFAAEQPPNIVFILSDDQAWTDYGFMGHPEIKTPHLDKLAEQSLVFERGYVAAPLCRPSLASMATGPVSSVSMPQWAMSTWWDPQPVIMPRQ